MTSTTTTDRPRLSQPDAMTSLPAVGATIQSLVGPHATGEVSTVTAHKARRFGNGDTLVEVEYVTTEDREGGFFLVTNVRGWQVVEPAPTMTDRFAAVLDEAMREQADLYR